MFCLQVLSTSSSHLSKVNLFDPEPLQTPEKMFLSSRILHMLGDITSGKEGAWAIGVQTPDAEPSLLAPTHVAPSTHASAAISSRAELESRWMCTIKRARICSSKGLFAQTQSREAQAGSKVNRCRDRAKKSAGSGQEGRPTQVAPQS